MVEIGDPSDGNEEDESDRYDGDYPFRGYYAGADDEGRWG